MIGRLTVGHPALTRPGWKITRIEISNKILTIFACEGNWFDKHHATNMQKCIDRDEPDAKFDQRA